MIKFSTRLDWITINRNLQSLIKVAAVAGCALATHSANAEDDSGLEGLVTLLTEIDDSDFQLDLLKGMSDGLKGRKRVPMPRGWGELYPKLAKSNNAAVQEQAKLLALTFGDPTALAELKQTMLDGKAKPEDRRAALAGLVDRNAPKLAGDLQALLHDVHLRGAALRGLAAYDHADTPAKVIAVYASLSLNEKQDAVATLASRPSYASSLMNAVANNTIPRGDITAFTARQIQAFDDEALSTQLKNVWGELRESPAEKKAEIAKFKKLLTPKYVSAGDARAGRVVYRRTCHQCHKLFGEGGQVGPELTGSNRASLDYVLENVITPSAAIAKDYQLRIFETVNGRLISGIVQETTPTAFVVQTATDRVLLSKADIEDVRISPKSMMPEGQWQKLSHDEIRNLVKYLASASQVPFPEGFDEAATAVSGE